MFKEGDMAKVIFWGKERSIQIVSVGQSGMYWARFNDTGRMQWFHRESVQSA